MGDMRIPLVLLTGMAFCLGLLLGLLSHLPGAQSPLQRTVLLRHSRDLRQAVSPEPVLGNASEENPALEQIEHIQQRIEQTQESIKALKENHHSVHVHKEPSTDIYDGIYWSNVITANPGFTESQSHLWRKQLQEERVVGLQEGCGRMHNRLVTLANGNQACARYRINRDQMQGEVYSYYLARVLAIYNVPPVVLALPDAKMTTWNSVAEQLTSAQWSSGRVVALTPWLKDLTSAYVPVEMQPGGKGLYPNQDLAKNRTLEELSEVSQWSDLIILDYLTANVDRVVNNMFNQQWNDDMMRSPVHNLEKTGNTLVFLDNESGLFHSYRLLDKYWHYHDTLLKSLCIFRKETADIVKRLYASRTVAEEVVSLMEREEPLNDRIARFNERTIKTLQSRLDDVYKQIISCESKYH
uniref:Four-jointed n=2 Tax=Platynereis dumerilii TaxID=6359 RepID=A0A2H5BFE1_PLADU|nr:four-jointed [Platynereis dumerilii]